ncbi:MAG: hypothetical protein JWP44_5208 [Mucilaginibacter sp.]|nr:hypothetical protein [Mucilaginibacter sp.]
MATSAALDGRLAELLLVFSTPRLAGEELLAGVADLARGASVVGCSAAADIGPDGVGEDGVLVLALGGAGFRARTAAAPSHNGPRSAGRVVAERLGPCRSRGDEFVLMLSAAHAGDQNEVVRGVYGVLGGAVPLVGGTTGNLRTGEPSLQFHGARVTLDGVVGAAVTSDGPFSIAVEHGLRRIGEPMVVSRSRHGRILELDGEPALDHYLGSLGAPAEAWSDAGAFEAFAAAHPLGLSLRGGSVQARSVAAAGFVERTLECVADVPQGGLVWAATTDRAAALAATERACEQALAGLEDRPPQTLLVFDCLGRRRLLGPDGSRAELSLITGAAAGAAVAGVYTHGEIARTRGLNAFHNETIVVLALA